MTLRALLTFYCTFFHPNILRHTSRLIIFFSCGCKTKRQGINYGGQRILSKNVLQDSRHKMQTDLRLHPILTGLLYFNFSETKKGPNNMSLIFLFGSGVWVLQRAKFICNVNNCLSGMKIKLTPYCFTNLSIIYKSVNYSLSEIFQTVKSIKMWLINGLNF